MGDSLKTLIYIAAGALLTLYIYFQIPLGALLLYPAFDALKKDAYEAAALLGAQPFQYWVKIGFPSPFSRFTWYLYYLIC